MTIEIAPVAPAQHAELTYPLRVAFGFQLDAARVARIQRLPELFQRFGAFDRGAVVGSAGVYRFTMTTPGGSIPTAGLTMVGVLPTHRRRGILTRLMRRHLDEARAAGFAVSALWATEAAIYGRFGYGTASHCGAIALECSHARFRAPSPAPGSFRLLEEPEARATFPAIWDRVRAVTPGMMTRSDVWWEIRRTGDYDPSACPLQRVLLEIDGQPEGYALYRIDDKVALASGVIQINVSVMEAVATSPRATHLLWRYLCELDLVHTLSAAGLPMTHPLLHLITEPRRLHMKIEDALWLRLIDVPAALAARTWQSRQAITFALDDSFCPWNEGIYRLDGAAGRVTPTGAPPDLHLDAAALAALYLGGVTPRQLADAGDIVELREGAIDRATALFASARAPWCPEIF